MRILLALTMFCLLFSFGCKGKAPATEKAWVDVQDLLNVRSAPDATASVVGTLRGGTEVEIIETKGADLTIGGKSGKWTSVKSGATTGWVFGGFLTKEKKGTGLGKHLTTGTYLEKSVFEKHGKEWRSVMDGHNTLPSWSVTSDTISRSISGPDGEDTTLKIQKITTDPRGVVVEYDGKFMANGAERETYFKGTLVLQPDGDRLTLIPSTDLRQWKSGQTLELIRVP